MSKFSRREENQTSCQTQFMNSVMVLSTQLTMYEKIPLISYSFCSDKFRKTQKKISTVKFPSITQTKKLQKQYSGN